MQFIHSEPYQGAIAAAHVEFPARELYGKSKKTFESQTISPVVIDQLGGVTFLPPTETVDEAIAAARDQIERNNRSYMDYVIEDRMPAENAVQHFNDCGIPLEMVPPLAVERPYFLPSLSSPIGCLFSE